MTTTDVPAPGTPERIHHDRAVAAALVETNSIMSAAGAMWVDQPEQAQHWLETLADPYRLARAVAIFDALAGYADALSAAFHATADAAAVRAAVDEPTAELRPVTLADPAPPRYPCCNTSHQFGHCSTALRRYPNRSAG